MQRTWSPDDLQRHWHLGSAEKTRVYHKSGATRLGFAVLLKCFQLLGRFPDTPDDIPDGPVTFLAKQVEVAPEEWAAYPWTGRSWEYHRAEIREFCGFTEMSARDANRMRRWLISEIAPNEHREDRLLDAFQQRCKQERIEPPTVNRSLRLIRSAMAQHDGCFRSGLFRKFQPRTLTFMDALLNAMPSSEASGDDLEWTLWQKIKGEPGAAGLDSLNDAIGRLDIVSLVDLPMDALAGIPPKLIDRYARQAAVEEPFELRRHKPALRCALQSCYLLRRKEVLTDNCVDALLAIIQKMTKSAQNRVDEKVNAAIQKASGKYHRLYDIAKATLAEPQGIVEKVVYPAASRLWLQTLVDEVESNSLTATDLKFAIQRSYRSHYRRAMPNVLRRITFRSAAQDAPILKALRIVIDHMDSKQQRYPGSLDVPITGIVPIGWRGLVLEGSGRGQCVNRVAYEICVLMVLREKLKCREIWVEHARRYRNPEEDLPKDFKENKAKYYATLGLSETPSSYVRALREEMTTALKNLDRTLPDNPKVALNQTKDGYRFRVSPTAPMDDPLNLALLKDVVFQRWGGTTLLDVLKETDLQLNFTKHLRSGSERSNLDQNTLRRRKLLCLFAMGTNTGIKNMEQGRQEEYKQLLYVRRRHFTPEGIREAIGSVVNATLRIRDPSIWGEATTACASDSKQFRSWDQNLMTEWHLRYGGRGIMVYWHVDKNYTCIHSQLKRVSSSEAGAMINGVLRHCTEMEIDRQYVDTHGQSTVAFGVSRLLGFELMPRIKGIHRFKLHRSTPGLVLPHLDNKVMSPGSINWELIESQFDAMIKHVVALKLGIADAESMLRRFTRNGSTHPVYKAFVEFGKAVKTIFACKYFMSEELRSEIHQGLNVVECWNSINGFIFYGNESELASNKQDDQEMGLLCLHLLQASLVYINTIMIQRVLEDRSLAEKMTERDLSALSPLLTQHINKYGRFELDFRKRLRLCA